MENPFVKLVGEGDEPSVEEREVVDTHFEIRDDDCYVQDVYEDGSVSLEWTPLHVDPADTEVTTEAYKAYRQEKGILEEAELNL